MGKLQRFPGNARRGNVEEIRASVRRLGQYRTIVVRDTGNDLVILAGNHTADALEAEGFKKVRCEVITCDDDEARRVNLATTASRTSAEDDNDALVELLLPSMTTTTAPGGPPRTWKRWQAARTLTRPDEDPPPAG